MGNNCCNESNSLIEYKKIIRADLSQTFRLNSTNKNSDSKISKNGIILSTFFVEKESFEYSNLSLKIVKSLDSLSQISIENYIYFCGQQSGSVDSGSILLKHDVISPLKTLTHQVSSIYGHYKPSLTTYKKEYIVVIGGKSCLKCEIFNIKTNKWNKLTDLPEERYEASIVCDDSHESLYLFGGSNTKQNIYCKTILKLSFKNKNWDTILVSNSLPLMRSQFAIYNQNDEFIYIFGGKTSDQSSTNNIVVYNIKKNVCEEKAFYLEKNCISDSNSITLINSNIYFIDDDNIVHNVNISENSSKIIKTE